MFVRRFKLLYALMFNVYALQIRKLQSWMPKIKSTLANNWIIN